MATKINVKGVIVGNDLKEIYDYYDIESTCPNDVLKAFPLKNSPIEIIINSGGGHVDAGSEMYSIIKEYPGETVIKILGLAASAASVIAMAGDRVIMSPTAQLMIHNVSSIAQGDYNEMIHQAGVLKEMNKSIANAYILKTGKSESEILQMMNKESWLSARTALQEGFVDEIMGVSSENLSEFLVASSHSTGVLPYSVIEKYRAEKKIKPSNKKKTTNKKRSFFDWRMM